MQNDGNSSQKAGEESQGNCQKTTGETPAAAKKPESVPKAELSPGVAPAGQCEESGAGGQDGADGEGQLGAVAGTASLLRLREVEPWPEPVDGSLLLDELTGKYRRFVVLPQWVAETLALFTPHSYAFDLRDVTTYLGVESPEKRCGKTTLLAVLAELVNRPLAMANISSPAFFRVVEEMQPTLLIDEMDTFLRRRTELRGILNAGYTRATAYVVRVVNEAGRGGKPRERGAGVGRFSCWCPKVMATIDHLPGTLADRCILFTLQRKGEHEQCERVRHFDGSVLRRKCLRFVLDHAEAIAAARPEIPASLNDRAADIWEPLLVLADIAGGKWPELARQAAVGVTASAQQSSPILSLALDIFHVFIEAKAERLFSRDLVWRLNALAPKPRPWAVAKKRADFNELKLSQQLRDYGIRSRTIWIGGKSAKGYLRAEFDELLRKYIPWSEVEAIIESKSEGGEKPPEVNPNGTGAS